MTRAYLGLGSNVGDRTERLQTAVDGLSADPELEVVAVSRVYETEPVGGPEQPRFLNAVVAVETGVGARPLLERARRLEVAAGREPDPDRRERWGPRELDVDVLLVEGETVDEADLVVPHPRMGERAFVLAPLADVAPGSPVVRSGRSRFAGWPGVRPTEVELRY